MSSDEEESTSHIIPSILEFDTDDVNFKKRVPVSRRIKPPREDDPDKVNKEKIMFLLEKAKALPKLEHNENYMYSEEKYVDHSEYKKMLRMIDELESLHKKFDLMFNTRGVVNPFFIVITHIRPKMCLNNEDSQSIWLSNKERELISFKKD
jgi:hypothetical protein